MVAGGHTSCVLLTGGTAKCFGESYNFNHWINPDPIVVAGLSGATVLAQGEAHTCAIVPGGAVNCWGSDSNYQLGFPPGVSLPAAVSGLVARSLESLDHLVLMPATAQVAPGDYQPYVALGFDASGNYIADVTGATTMTVDGGSCVGAYCTATGAGDHIVTGVLGSASGTATLHVLATISGIVTNGVAGLGGIEVFVFDPADDTLYGDVVTSSGGAWSVAVPVGTYALYFYDASGTYASGYLGEPADSFTYDLAAARSIALAGEDVEDQNIVLPPALRIGGTVRNAYWSGISGIEVFLYDSESFASVGAATTVGGGYYSIVVTPGSYYVEFWDPDASYPDGYWSASGFTQDFMTADAVTVSTSDQTADCQYPVAYRVGGNVTNVDSTAIEGIEVSYFNESGNLIARTATDEGGAYFAPLAAGSYYVAFVDPTGTYATGFWDGTGFTPDINAIVAVPVSAVAMDIDVALPEALGAPTDVKAVPANGSAAVSWTAPTSTGGAPITAYTVIASDGLHTCDCPGGLLSCMVIGLTNGTSYTFTVVAINVGGPGPESDPSNAVTPALLPGKPTGVTASAGSGSASVSWTAPSSNGGSPITRYDVTSSPDGKTCAWTSGPLTCTIVGLSYDHQYTFSVVASTGVGAGPASDPSAAVTPVGPATSLSVGPVPTPYVVGVSAGLTVSARDAAGYVDVGYRGRVYFSSSDLAATVPADYTFTAADAGTHTFSLTMGTLGTHSITATDMATRSITGSLAGVGVVGVAASYTAISPARILDTRPTVKSGNPTNIGLTGKFITGTVRTFLVAGARYVGGGNSIAVPSNATAVTGNLTIVNATAGGLVALGPSMSATGDATTINFARGETRANNVTVGLSPYGQLSAVFRSSSWGSTDVIFDVTGFFVPGSTGASYHTVAPGRVLDSRPTTGASTNIGLKGKFTNRKVRVFSVAGVVGLGWSSALVPAGATAVTGNLTVTNATSSGYVALGPLMSANPSTSTVNVAKRSNCANGVTVALNGGKLQAVWAGTLGSSADVVFDVTGFFTPDASGLLYHPIDPIRLLDSSAGKGLGGAFTDRTTRALTVAGVGVIPSDASGISGNLTLISPSSGGYAFVSPAPVSSPSSSTVNVNARSNVANGFDVGLGAGSVSLIWCGTNGSNANFQLDVTGYWK